MRGGPWHERTSRNVHRDVHEGDGGGFPVVPGLSSYDVSELGANQGRPRVRGLLLAGIVLWLVLVVLAFTVILPNIALGAPVVTEPKMASQDWHDDVVTAIMAKFKEMEDEFKAEGCEEVVRAVMPDLEDGKNLILIMKCIKWKEATPASH